MTSRVHNVQMSPSAIAQVVPAVAEKAISNADSTPTRETAKALEAAQLRFADRNKKSLKLHEVSVKSLPGGNTRSLLHTPPFPIFLKSGKGYQVTSEDGHVYTDLVGEMTAALYG